MNWGCGGHRQGPARSRSQTQSQSRSQSWSRSHSSPAHGARSSPSSSPKLPAPIRPQIWDITAANRSQKWDITSTAANRSQIWDITSTAVPKPPSPPLPPRHRHPLLEDPQGLGLGGGGAPRCLQGLADVISYRYLLSVIALCSLSLPPPPPTCCERRCARPSPSPPLRSRFLRAGVEQSSPFRHVPRPGA